MEEVNTVINALMKLNWNKIIIIITTKDSFNEKPQTRNPLYSQRLRTFHFSVYNGRG